MEKHFAVSGFVLNEANDKVLMVFHKKLGVWVIPGGHLEPNEYPHEGAKREILEETGVDAEIVSLASFKMEDNNKESVIPTPILCLSETIPAKGDKPEHVHMDLIYLAVADSSLPLKQQEEEVDAVKWMSFEEVLASDTFESVKQLVRIQKGGE